MRFIFGSAYEIYEQSKPENNQPKPSTGNKKEVILTPLKVSMKNLFNIFKIGVLVLLIFRISFRSYLNHFIDQITYILLIICFAGGIILGIYFYLIKNR